MFKAVFILSLIFSLPLKSKIKKFETTETRILEFNLKKVCKELQKENLLVEAHNAHQIDCTGEIVDVDDYCKEKLTPTNIPFIRAVVQNKKLLCQSAKTVTLSLGCVGKYKSFCKSKNTHCEILGKRFAKDLKLSFAGVSESEEVSLNCYYLDTESVDQLELSL